MKYSRLYLCSLLVAIAPICGHAEYIFKEGKLINKKEFATMTVQEHYSAAMSAYQNKKWEDLVTQAIIVVKNFPGSPFAEDAMFYLGIGYFELEDYELANEKLSAYLKKQATPKHFEEAIQYKFAIAEKFKGGAKKRVFGLGKMPKWMPAREEALSIYDEVITALPHHDLSAQALFGKAKLFFKDEDYRESIDAYQTLILRFPKHRLAPESYIGIGEVYLKECKDLYPDPDFLDLAEINLKKFRMDFPGEERVEISEKMVLEMKEIYASSLYDTGRFFERTKKPHASVIYYNKILSKYPETKVADLTKKRLADLKKNEKTPSPQEEAAVNEKTLSPQEEAPANEG